MADEPREFYSNLHVGERGRHWEDAREFGFLAHGQAKAHLTGRLKPFLRLRRGDRVWVRLTNKGDKGQPQIRGFVGRGRVLAEPAPVSRALLHVDGAWRPFAELQPQMTGVYPDLGEGPTAEWIAPIEWEATLDAEDALGLELVDYYDQNWTVLLQPDENDRQRRALAQLLRFLPIDMDATVDEVSDDTALDMAVRQAHGQGRAANTREVDLAGMNVVMKHLGDLGWDVQDVSQDVDRATGRKLGYDLLATRPGRRLCVEVKATKTSSPSAMLITANEVAEARTNADWVLAFVTHALERDPDPVHWFSRHAAVETLAEKVYRASLDPATAASSPEEVIARRTHRTAG